MNRPQIPTARALTRSARATLRRVGVDVRRVQPARPFPGYYPVSHTCQIANLGFIYETFFGQRADGLFVEVGAFDGYSFSNTSCLAAAGWHGHYVEPVPDHARMCRDRYASNPKITVSQLAIAAEEGELELRTAGAYSSTDPSTFAEYQDADWAREHLAGSALIKVPTLPLDSFLEQQGVGPSFDVLVVDVEGAELQVFAGFDVARWRPKMMILELADLNPDLEAHRADYAGLLRSLLHHGYAVVYKNVINTVLVTDEVLASAYGLHD